MDERDRKSLQQPLARRAPPPEGDTEPPAAGMAQLAATLGERLAESARLDREIERLLAALGYDIRQGGSANDDA